ncbi:lysostaphin resistance A-like protein [Ornithobacterium rhinotracheale]|uniref:CPBP family intramembrane glutamic endopeptidase n=1 Tax=Ornithobacterium rhinotracheale TaxID=28251 RepID=UPI003FA4AC51
MKIENLNNYKLSYWGAFGVFLFVVLIANVATLPFIALQLFLHLSDSYMMALGFGVGFGSAAIFTAIILGLNLNQLLSFFAKSKHLKYFALAVLIYIPTLPISEFLAGLVPTDSPEYLARWYEQMESTFEGILKDPIPAFISVSILAPLLEELIFRGLILRGLLNSGKNPYFSIIFVSLLFGLAHGNPWQFLAAGFLGFILGFIYWRTRDLWICIFLHFFNNTISFILTSIMGKDLDDNIFEPNYLLIFAAILGVVATMYLFYKQTQKDQLQNI